MPKDLKLQRLSKNCFKEVYKAEHLKALSIPHSKAKAKPKTINSGCGNKESRTSDTDAEEMGIIKVSIRIERNFRAL